ncbi:vesicle coat protein [Jimgerdemannia flammicorona]|uniref:Vesicle coat protein n=1 Tax=Jimgerdemannia flammicorona TaxID=994334 RepID=A0A433PFM2_9FUNG|nr:vesicle coat protein [Jimgerdemannia flammicorona]
MNALCALLHFCDLHGPRTVFCTQAFHTPTLHVPDIPPTRSTPNSPPPSSHLSRRVPHTPAADPPSSESSGTTRKQARQPPTGGPTPTATSSAGTSSCPACTAQIPFVTVDGKDGSPWTQEARGFYTKDDEDANVHYFGSRAPGDPQLYSAVRNACVRSLSIEFCPGRDGPVLFGDDANGYVLSYMFRLQDIQARGEMRFYSLIMLMTDRVYLVSCWPFLVRAFRSIAMNLQEKADIIFMKEKEAKERQQAMMMSGRRTSFAPTSPGMFLGGAESMN